MQLDTLLAQLGVGILAGIVAALLVEGVFFVKRRRDTTERHKYAIGAVRFLLENFIEDLLDAKGKGPSLGDMITGNVSYSEERRFNRLFSRQLDVLERFIDSYRDQWTPYEQFAMLYTCAEYRRFAEDFSSGVFLDSPVTVERYLDKWYSVGWDWVRNSERGDSLIPQNTASEYLRTLRAQLVEEVQSQEELLLLSIAFLDFPCAPPKGFEDSSEGLMKFFRTVLDDYRNGKDYRYGSRSRGWATQALSSVGLPFWR